VKKKFSIIFCIYNEEEILRKKLDLVLNYFNKENKIKKIDKIILIDNKSEDNSRKILKNLQKNKYQNLKIKLIFNSKNLGKGGSIKKAVNAAKSEYCAIFDIDEYEPSDIFKGIKKLNLDHKIDFLVGNRIHKNIKFKYRTNFIGVKFLSFLYRILYNEKISDTACAIKIFKKNYIHMNLVHTNNFDFEFDLLCKFSMKKAKIKQFNVQYYPRSYAEGKKLNPIIDGVSVFFILLKNYFL
jgi:dolichol-phosphate mannosyltransferase